MDIISMQRRALLLSSLFGAAAASPIDPRDTLVLSADRIKFRRWGNVPRDSSEMAPLYGDINKPGPYLVMMKWYPGWFSAPHDYATDRIQVVVSGIWWVNSGADFDPQHTVPVTAGGFVLRHARTWHYDGVPASGREPVVIAVFGTGPVDIRLADSTKPSWRHV
jgi:hypothetical protein